MLALLFAVLVLASLTTSMLLALDVIPGSPGALALIGGLHLLFGWAFLRGYLGYRALHRLVHEGRGELFDMAIGHRIAHGRFRGFRDHYRLRRIQGLALAGLPGKALEAAEDFRRHVTRTDRDSRLRAAAAAAEADLLLGQPWWAEQALDGVAGERDAAGHPAIAAVTARLAHARGDAADAADRLAGLTGAGHFPLTRAIRSRNLFWYGEALADLGRPAEAATAYRRAAKLAPTSMWGMRAARRR